MKKFLILLFLLFTVIAYAGTTSTNGYFYLPDATENPTTGRPAWIAVQESTDTVIKSNADHVADNTQAHSDYLLNTTDSLAGTLTAGAFVGDGSGLTGISSGSGSGTVNLGTAGYGAYYASTGTVISGNSLLAYGTGSIEIGGNFYVDGNVGIGTTAPSGILDIEGGDVFLGTASLDNISSDEDLLVSGNLEVENDAYFDAPITPYANTAPVTSENGEFAFRTNGWATDRGNLQVFDGTANTIMVGALYSDSPNNGQVPKWNTGGTITWENDNNSAGITGTDTHVLFFDGNDNPAGEADYTYNKTTNTVTADAFEATPSATPIASFTDSDSPDGDVSAQIFVNYNDGSGSGTEDVDLAIQTQLNGVMTNAIYIDADVGVNITGVLSENTRTVSGTYSKGFGLETPTDADALVPVWTPNVAVTFSRIYCVVTGAAATVRLNLTDDTNDMDEIVCDVDGQEDTSLSNASFSADETIYMEVIGIGNTVSWVNITGDYTID